MADVIRLCYSEINLDTDSAMTATKLRSYLGYKFIADTDFHHHDDNPYRYPLIQYKRINSKPYVLGIGDCAVLVFKRMSGLQSISLAKKTIPITSIVFNNTSHTISDKITWYKFVTPWIALNAENYAKLKSLDMQFQKRFLEDILVGNILSLLKGVGIRINYRLYVQVKWYKEVPVIVHDHRFSGFYAKFVANLSLPKYIGVGKSVSKGFGIIQKTDDN